VGQDDEPPDQSERRLRDRRSAERFDVVWSVDCAADDTFLYASITNISELGIFVRTNQPLQVGTKLTLRFEIPGMTDEFVLTGQVQWVNPLKVLAENLNPGMGVRFIDLLPEERERIVEAVRTIAYVREAAKN
jgi:type IV pilus assembly protein PilZ